MGQFFSHLKEICNLNGSVSSRRLQCERNPPSGLKQFCSERDWRTLLPHILPFLTFNCLYCAKSCCFEWAAAISQLNISLIMHLSALFLFGHDIFDSYKPLESSVYKIPLSQKIPFNDWFRLVHLICSDDSFDFTGFSRQTAEVAVLILRAWLRSLGLHCSQPKQFIEAKALLCNRVLLATTVVSLALKLQVSWKEMASSLFEVFLVSV